MHGAPTESWRAFIGGRMPAARNLGSPLVVAYARRGRMHATWLHMVAAVPLGPGPACRAAAS